MNGKDQIPEIDREVLLQRFLSRFPDNGNPDTSSPFPPSGLAGSSTRSKNAIPSPFTRDKLGEPLAIADVARLLGCSAWTIRQRYLRQGLPYLQARPRGKLVFFREQVIDWIEKRQRQKGGILR
jgi:hypothetical protein